MKQVHFFGCSYTAGDELSDEEFFPWKKDCTDAKEYYTRRHQLMSEMRLEEYLRSNKDKAYPALIADNEIATYNHAVNGASIREMIFKAIQLVEQQVITDTSVVYFQIPPYPREVYISHIEISSLQMAGIGLIDKEEINNYKKSKWKSHDVILDQSANDILDMILLKGFFASKNIPVYLLILEIDLQSRLSDIRHRTQKYDYLEKLLFKSTEVLDIWHTKLSSISKLTCKSMGGHYNSVGHAIIANEIKKHILENKY